MMRDLLVVFLLITTATAPAKALLVPEYSAQKTVFLSLSNGAQTLAEVEHLARILAVLRSKEVPTTVLVGARTCKDLWGANKYEPSMDWTELQASQKRGIVGQLEARSEELCTLTHGTCSPSRTKYVCLAHKKRWLRNEFPLEAIDENTKEPIRFDVGKSSDILLALRKKGEKIVRIPIRANGPASFATDGLGENIYVSTQVRDLNPGLTPIEIERSLRRYWTFKKLVWLKPSPWEYSKDLDTIVMFAKAEDQKVHAFLATSPERPRRAAKRREFDFLTSPYATQDERLACEHLQENDPKESSALCWYLAVRDEPNLRKTWEAFYATFTQDTLQTVLERQCPRLDELRACVADFARKKHFLAEANDTSNFTELADAGFSPDRIHRLQSAGVYQMEFSTNDTSLSTYVNGLILENEYILPTYPGFESLDFAGERTDPNDIDRSFSEKTQTDQTAYDVLAPYFDQVTPVRADVISGGSIHCTTFSYYQ